MVQFLGSHPITQIVSRILKWSASTTAHTSCLITLNNALALSAYQPVSYWPYYQHSVMSSGAAGSTCYAIGLSLDSRL